MIEQLAHEQRDGGTKTARPPASTETIPIWRHVVATETEQFSCR